MCLAAELSRTVAFGSLKVERRGRMVFGSIAIPPIGCPSAKSSRIVVCGNLGVKMAGYVVIERIAVAAFGCPGFGIEYYSRTYFACMQKTCRVQNPEMPQAVRDGAGRGGAGRGGAWRGGSRRRRVCSPRRQPSLLHPRESKTTVLDDLQKHEQTESYVNRWRNKNHG